MDSIGPGPVYSLPPTIGYDKHDQRKLRNPQYTLTGRLKVRNVNIIPGPGINTSDYTQRGRSTSYAYSMLPRAFAKDPKCIGPGPANYDLTKKPYASKVAPPSYSVGRRDNFRFKKHTPGPNAYAIKEKMVKKTAPVYGLGIKTELKNKSNSPGPACYPASKLKVTMLKAPEYSVYARAKVDRKPHVPGANAYNHMNCNLGKSPPSYSFGIRHSKRAPPMIVACDNV